MTNEQLYLAIGLPTLLNAAMMGLLIAYINAKFSAVDRRFEAVDKRFDAVDRRFQAMESRFDRLGETVGSLVQQSAGFTRWAEQIDRSNAQILAIQQAQQHYMDKLADRTLKLEQQRPPQ